MTYIIFVCLVILNLAFYFAFELLTEKSSVNEFFITFGILFAAGLAIFLSTLFHWFWVRKTVSQRSKIEHIVIIILTIISLVYFYNNAVKLLYKIETSDPDYSNADAVMRIHTDYVFDLDRTISNE